MVSFALFFPNLLLFFFVLPGNIEAKGQPIKTDLVKIHVGAFEGQIKHRASGFLHGFSEDALLPINKMVAPLKVGLHRTRPSSTWAQAVKMQSLGIKQQVVMSDGWGYWKTRRQPGDKGNWKEWQSFIANMVQKSTKLGISPQWDIWNEPDFKGRFWRRSDRQFDEAWLRAYRIIKKKNPNAVIVGPSWARLHPGDSRFDNFLLFCKKNNVVPDYLSWHFPNDIVKEVNQAQEFLKFHEIKIKGVQINEYCLEWEQYAGRTSWLIAQLERAKVNASCHAIWADEGKSNLNGIIADPKNGTANAQWWVYQRYGEIEGNVVRTIPGKYIDLVAGINKQNMLKILLGNRGKPIRSLELVMTGFQSNSVFSKAKKIKITVERIPHSNGQKVVKIPVIFEKELVVYNDSATISISWMNEFDAYNVSVSPIKIGPNENNTEEQ